MPRLTRFHSLLDRFEERMQVDCERLKCQLIAQVDEQFGVLREKVALLRNQFGCGGQFRFARSAQVELPDDDPPVETIQLDEWKQVHYYLVQYALMELSSHGRAVPSTSTNRKRKSSSASGSVTNKRQATLAGTNDGSNKYQCNSPGCGQSFSSKYKLSRHERIHLSIKPFVCTWPDCPYSSVRKDNLILHVRTRHAFQVAQASERAGSTQHSGQSKSRRLCSGESRTVATSTRVRLFPQLQMNMIWQ